MGLFVGDYLVVIIDVIGCVVLDIFMVLEFDSFLAIVMVMDISCVGDYLGVVSFDFIGGILLY